MKTFVLILGLLTTVRFGAQASDTLVYHQVCKPVSNSNGFTINHISIKTPPNTTITWGLQPGTYANGYVDHTIDQYSSSYAFSLKFGTTFPFGIQMSQVMGVNVWIDLNNDSDFDDSGEMLLNFVPTTANPTNIPISIPAGNNPGWMRTRATSNGSSPILLNSNQSCVNQPFGMTDDRAVFIDTYCLAISTCTGSGNPGIQFGGFTTPSFLYKGVGASWYGPFQSSLPGMKANVVAGGTFPFTFNPGGSFAFASTCFGVWIDFNNNLSFDDPGEFVLNQPFSGYSPPITANITIPNVSGAIGDRRVRLRWSNSSPLNPTMSCSVLDDVTLDFTLAIQKSYGTLTTGNQNLCAPGNPANIAFGILPTPTGTKPYKYQWYSAPGLVSLPADNSITGWTAIPGATGTSYDPPAGLNASTTYACRWGSASADDFWAANPRQVRINGKGCSASRMAVAEGAISEEMETDIQPCLSQNFPNPFRSETKLSINLPTESQSATLEILAVDGRLIQQISLTGNGKQELTLSRKQFPSAGIYLCALVVDGQILARKRMVVTD